MDGNRCDPFYFCLSRSKMLMQFSCGVLGKDLSINLIRKFISLQFCKIG